MWITEEDQRKRGQGRPRSWCVGWGDPLGRREEQRREEEKREEERRESFVRGEDNQGMDRDKEENFTIMLKFPR